MLTVVDVTGVVQLWMLYVLVFALRHGAGGRQPDAPVVRAPSSCRRPISPTRSGSAARSSSSRASLGPALAGVLIVAGGTGICFALNAVSFVFVIGALLMMRTGRAAPVEAARAARRAS